MLRGRNIPLWAADGAEQDRVALLRVLQHVIRERSAELIDGVAADDTVLEFDIDGGTARDQLKNLQCLADDLGTDAVTLQN